ncbi:hypothetical protein NEPAR06_0476 [Nematocida parisii]|uniref:Uncharacterized protein n=1 Tax=Nematocida parisii (strain ERTm3) TaxID=935791 RepID=I3EJI1_NEMP3|nr:uncharacterized protein NEPG_01091 [Nematocida parisii ERTm1]EIJ89378.1 hypothetical protein NEQG_00148 [Nematocida parisii ERTm3]KAI5142606.1 hypothetical protein NEPAR07_0211 [Nematocida parisii]EIJ94423.1 hypothetical protein NEPG_01091 [Nematocida parisii ERTm1]KAI5153476.1 hypothetical protein NEPAR06_0476 [Nematocida parisii]KAI5156899.1 hypothetical protein NEPAR05_0882 [Nematocida parisii]|eukprot:XP_013058919.1 hypothetical protein NEPG_01091 [Nematocida parisii ERTm1]
MEGYIDEEILKAELQKGFSDKKGRIGYEDINKIYKILMDINRTTPIFKDLPEPLTNLAYNVFYIKINSRNIECDYNEDTAISAIKDSIAQIYAIIDVIKEGAETLDSESKKEAFYKLMGNNHMVMTEVYRYRKNFYDSSINILCKKAGISELNEEITSTSAIIKLCELAESGECSRLQRVLNILVKHGDNLTITNTDGEEQSNADKLGLTNDDIYSLQLLARTEESDFFEFTYNIINHLIYESIYVQDNDKDLHNSIPKLYYTIYKMFIMRNEFNLDKDKNKDTIKTCLNQLKNMKNIVAGRTEHGISRLNHYITETLNHTDFNIDKFRANLLKGYLKSIKSDVYDIVGLPIEGTTKKENPVTIDTPSITDNENVAIAPPVTTDNENATIAPPSITDNENPVAIAPPVTTDNENATIAPPSITDNENATIAPPGTKTNDTGDTMDTSIDETAKKEKDTIGTSGTETNANGGTIDPPKNEETGGTIDTSGVTDNGNVAIDTPVPTDQETDDAIDTPSITDNESATIAPLGVTDNESATIDTPSITDQENNDTIDPPVSTKKGICFKTIIIVAVIMIVIAIVFSIVFLYFNGANKIMNIFNIL